MDEQRELTEEELKRIRIEKELRKIKDKFGEKIAHICRIYLQSVLEQEELLYNTLIENFGRTKSLGEYIEAIIEFYKKDKEFSGIDKLAIERKTIEAFCDYIIRCIPKRDEERLKTDKSPQELLDEKGYILYECHTEEEIQRFKKYYAPGEELCTFKGGRLKICHVFFAVKKDVEKYVRENFPNPKREDEYSKSVLGIQFTRGKTNVVSIKSRYNHTVSLPDNVHKNKLDKIAPGLEEAFARKYGFNLATKPQNEERLPFIKAADGKYYALNLDYYYTKGNITKAIYFCPENIIIEDGKVIDTYAKNKERYIVMDYFILDLSEKKITTYPGVQISDSFIEGLQNIQRIDISKDEKGNKTIIITLPEDKQATIVIDKRNAIISYKNDNLKTIGDNFLANSLWVKKIDLPNVEKVGDSFLESCLYLEEINLPKVEVIGKYALSTTQTERISFPKLREVGKSFNYNNKILKIIDCPELERAPIDSFFRARNIPYINLPKLKIDLDGIDLDFTDHNPLLIEYLAQRDKVEGRKR